MCSDNFDVQMLDWLASFSSSLNFKKFEGVMPTLTLQQIKEDNAINLHLQHRGRFLGDDILGWSTTEAKSVF